MEPYDVRGIFESEEEAQQFLNWYTEQYDLDDSEHFELYTAELEYQGSGSDNDENQGEAELPEQASIGQFHDKE